MNEPRATRTTDTAIAMGTSVWMSVSPVLLPVTRAVINWLETMYTTKPIMHDFLYFRSGVDFLFILQYRMPRVKSLHLPEAILLLLAQDWLALQNF